MSDVIPVQATPLNEIGLENVTVDGFFSESDKNFRFNFLSPEPVSFKDGYFLEDYFPDKDSSAAQWARNGKSYLSSELFFIRLKNVFVFPNRSAIMLAPGVFLKESLNSVCYGDQEKNFDYLARFLPNITKTDEGLVFDPEICDRADVIEDTVMLVNTVQDNYGHWHLDSLLSAYGIRDWILEKDVKFLMPSTKNEPRRYRNRGWIHDSLTALGMGGRLLGTPEPIVFCRDLIYSSRMFTLGTNQPPPLFNTMTSEIAQRIARDSSIQIRQPDYIFLMRKGGGAGRYMVNEEALAAGLQSYGFDCLVPDNFGFADEVKFFGQAKILICQTGSAILNAAYAPEGCIICEIGTGDVLFSAFVHVPGVTGKRYVMYHVPELVRKDPSRAVEAANRDQCSFEVPLDSFLPFVARLMELTGVTVNPETALIRAMAETKPEIERGACYQVLDAPFSPDQVGTFAYAYHIPELARYADGIGTGPRSPLRLLENGQPIGQPHSSHHDIRTIGGGRYSHWNNHILFSTSDNSDPNTNGRTYSIYLDR